MLGKTENCNLNYAAKICRIEEIKPIYNANSIVRARIGNDLVVVSNDMKVGDIVVYFPLESQISDKYLKANNLYAHWQNNANASVIARAMDRMTALEEKEDKTQDEQVELDGIKSLIRKNVGFFQDTGRVRMLKLRGVYSMGFVAPVSTLEEAWPMCRQVLWNHYLDQQFDTVCNEMLCQKYIPAIKTPNEPVHNTQKRWLKAMRRTNKFDRLIPGQFAFHYDTTMLADNMDRFLPETNVDITKKVHGQQVTIANVLINKKLSFGEKIKKFFGLKVQDKEYGLIGSSRRVIKNRYINKNVKDGYYGDNDYYMTACLLLEPYMDDGMTVYAELVGYKDGTNTPIQIDHDYGCRPGQWKLMPFRITTTNPQGDVFEWEVGEVIGWTNKLIYEHPEVAKNIMVMELFYHGEIGRINKLWEKVNTDDSLIQERLAARTAWQHENPEEPYPEYLISDANYRLWVWRNELLDYIKTPHNMFMMEDDEPLCTYHKVPMEGIVIRICQDKIAEACKIKSKRHYIAVGKLADKGIDVDAE